jgi:type II secretory pathway pseudopilin PulG
MAKGISFWGVLVIMIIVAAIASLITLSITGNTVKSNEASSSAETYTKAEVDSMFDALREDLETQTAVVSGLGCDENNTCLVGDLSAEGNIQSSFLSNPDSPLRTDNAYLCVTKEGVLYRGTSVGCK